MKAAPGQQMIDKNKLKANIVAVAVLLIPGGTAGWGGRYPIASKLW